ncbi:MAG: Gfo/Idh/MocA family oxidoreductase [Prolixibacteraceae bacterium]|nr:Gfo/Idh/MocA family oxidoreductase [Prolixibacteraceae bacterium]
MNISRRRFILNTGLAAGALAVPTIIPSCVRGANDKINLVMIGVGDHGMTWNLPAYLKLDDCRVVAVSDVDLTRARKAKKIIDDHYQNQDCQIFHDFREVLARKQFDAVQISTPDHWHVPMSVLAIQAGKDVCCEKPTHTINQGRILCDVVARHDRVYQTSLEDRSLFPYHRMAELARNGRIGKIQKIVCGLPGAYNLRYQANDFTVQQPPKEFFYDMWLGPAPEAPYSPGRCHWNFRWIFDYSGGSICDWGSHIIDTAQRALGTEKSGPVSVEGTGIFGTEGLYNTAHTYRLIYEYESGAVMEVHSEKVEIRIEGTDGWLYVNGWNGKLEASSEEILNSEIGSNEIHLSTDQSEHANFLKCIRSRAETYHPVEDVHRNSTIAHMGNIAMILGRKLHWDVQKEEFVNDAEANSMRSKPERDPWKLEDLVNI